MYIELSVNGAHLYSDNKLLLATVGCHDAITWKFVIFVGESLLQLHS